MKKGQKHTEESKRKNSEAHKGKHTWMKGKHHTAESLRKISEAKKGQHIWPNGRFFSAEHRKHISEGRTGKPSIAYWKGKKRSVEYRKKISELWRDYYADPEKRRRLIDQAAKVQGKDTRIELLAQESLAKHNYSFVTQYPVEGVCIADIRLLDYMFIVFVDGCYWHQCPSCYPSPNTQTRQAKRIAQCVESDKRITVTLQLLGWIVFRFWEHEIKQNPDVVGATVEKELTQQVLQMRK